MNVALIHFYLSNSETEPEDLYGLLTCDNEKNVYLVIIAYKFIRRYGNEFMSGYDATITLANLVERIANYVSVSCIKQRTLE